MTSLLNVLLLVNPAASRAERSLGAARDWLTSQCNLETVLTQTPEEVAARIRSDGGRFDRIIVGGGDGTLSAALPALLEADRPLAVLPLGTANDFARTISVPLDPVSAAEIAVQGRVHRIDLGVVNGRHFVNVASIGIATKVTKAQSKSLKRLWRGLSYLLTLRKVLGEAKAFAVDIEIDGADSWEGKAYQVSVGNGRHHGGGMTVAEEAALDDGVLHLYVVRPGTRMQLLKGLAELRLGRPVRSEALELLAGHAAVVKTREPMPVNTDGEITTETPAAFTVLRQALQVIVPQTMPVGQKGLAHLSEPAP